MKEVSGEEVNDGWSGLSVGDEFRGGTRSFRLVGNEDLVLIKWFSTISDTADAICLLKSASLRKISSDL